MEFDLFLQALQGLNNNRVFIGVAMMIMNIGSRYVIADLTDVHQKLMSSPIFKRIILFCMFFVATRDVMISVILTFAFIFIVHGLLNEKRKFNLIPHGLRNNPSSSSSSSVEITPIPQRNMTGEEQVIETKGEDVHRLMFQTMLNTFEPLKTKFF